ncbi:MAG: response regulator, partial [Candidatus Latescibacteria bacterium]|nr:response regulator [Candidatus Latescibacterota bacterium]NIO77384.1 response regulator [Candidatus Latescibacterota bacterium]
DPNTRSIPVVIHSIIENKPLALGLGAEDYLAKPIDPNQLIKMAKRYLLGRQKPIMVVDDNDDFVRLTSDILEAEGFRCVVAYDGREALEKLKQDEPALILLDLIMPVMDGFEVVEAMQKDPALKK